MNHDEKHLLKYVEGEAVEMLALLEQLVNINSSTDNPDGVARVVDRLVPLLREINMNVEIHPGGDRGPHLLARSAGAGHGSGTAALMLGHTDTVFGVDDPFQTYSRDEERVFGPGVCDMKGGIVVMLYAIRALHSEGILDEADVTLLLNSDEERHSMASRGLVEQAAMTADVALTFEAGRPGGGVVTSRKAVGEYFIEVFGKAAHAGANHEQGASALEAAARKVADLNALTDYERGTTVTVGVLNAGFQSNIVPDRALLRVDVRYPDRAALRPLDEAVRRIALREDVAGTHSTVEAILSRPPMPRTEETGRLYDFWSGISEELGQTIREVATGGASDANIAASCGVPAIDGLGPIGGRSHSDEEWADVRSFVERAQVCALALARMTREKLF